VIVGASGVAAGEGGVRSFAGVLRGKAGDPLSAVGGAHPLAGVPVAFTHRGHTAVCAGGSALEVVGAAALMAGHRGVWSLAAERLGDAGHGGATVVGAGPLPGLTITKTFGGYTDGGGGLSTREALLASGAAAAQGGVGFFTGGVGQADAAAVGVSDLKVGARGTLGRGSDAEDIFAVGLWAADAVADRSAILVGVAARWRVALAKLDRADLVVTAVLRGGAVSVGVGLVFDAGIATLAGECGGVISVGAANLRAGDVTAIGGALVDQKIALRVVAALAFDAIGPHLADASLGFLRETGGVDHIPVDVGADDAVGVWQGDHHAGQRGLSTALHGYLPFFVKTALAGLSGDGIDLKQEDGAVVGVGMGFALPGLVAELKLSVLALV